MRVLTIEDDPALSRSIVQTLRACSAVADTATTGEEGYELARLYDYDIVVLDLLLPDCEGYDVLRRLRNGRVQTPVMVLSGSARSQSRIKAFNMGADDFMAKPFDPDEFVARIRAIVRRSKGFSQPRLSFGGLTLNLESREVFVDETPLHLTAKEYSVLELLMLRKGMVMTKEGFLNHLYGGIDEPEIKIVDVFICKLRKKLAQAGVNDLICTVWGRGYMIRDSVATDPARASAPAARRPPTADPQDVLEPIAALNAY